MSTLTPTATALLRAMRGRAQSRLLGADDTRFYVTKFASDRLSQRLLVNEWIGSRLLEYLEIETPGTVAVRVTEEFLKEHGSLTASVDGAIKPVAAGVHLGSEFPEDPTHGVVYDFLPDSLLARVENLRDFWGALVLDKWCGNADSRQAIFVRVPGAVGSNAGAPQQRQFRALMIDQDHFFDGAAWRIHENPTRGPYFRPIVYDGLKSCADLEPWLSKIRQISPWALERIFGSVPASWASGNQVRLDGLRNELWTRRNDVNQLVTATAQANPTAFRDWQGEERPRLRVRSEHTTASPAASSVAC